MHWKNVMSVEKQDSGGILCSLSNLPFSLSFYSKFYSNFFSLRPSLRGKHIQRHNSATIVTAHTFCASRDTRVFFPIGGAY